MELFIVRHGQSGNNALSAPTGRDRDPALTPAGEQQAARVGPFIAAGSHLDRTERDGRPYLDFLYCSPMIRALQTAQPIGAALGLNPEVWVDIHEQGGIFLDHGGDTGHVGYPGQTRSQIRERFPDYVLPDQIGEDGWWNKGFEEVHQCHGRAMAAAQALRRCAGEGSRLGVVTHGGFTNSLIKALWHELPGDGFAYEHRNTAITRIDVGTERLVVRYMNRVEHLPEALIT